VISKPIRSTTRATAEVNANVHMTYRCVVQVGAVTWGSSFLSIGYNSRLIDLM